MRKEKGKRMRLGALEAGGTKMVLAVGDESGKIEKELTIPTTTPQETIPKMIEFFVEHKVEALGIGCFGPIDLNPASMTYGYITTTPKVVWRNCNLVGAFKSALQIPIGFDTDVNAAALGEATWGSTKGLSDSIYITIGTGIGVGVMQNNSLLHGMLHPEAGHILLMKSEEDSFLGKCPYHKTCFEGLASGPAIEKRWGNPAQALTNRKEVWELEAYYIAQALMNYILVLSPKRIVLGGGVMKQEQLFPLIRRRVTELLNGYIVTREIEDMEHYIVPAALQGRQGILGGLALATQAYHK